MTTLKGLRPTATAAQRCLNPVGVAEDRPPLPRVARPERSADFPVRSNPGTLYGSGKFCNPPFFHAAADWKVRAPFLNPPCGTGNKIKIKSRGASRYRVISARPREKYRSCAILTRH